MGCCCRSAPLVGRKVLGGWQFVQCSRALGSLAPWALQISERYADQHKIYEDIGGAIIANANKGFNCSIFAYGETGAGKSYSLLGYGGNKGLLPNTCAALFDQVK